MQERPRKQFVNTVRTVMRDIRWGLYKRSTVPGQYRNSAVKFYVHFDGLYKAVFSTTAITSQAVREAVDYYTEQESDNTITVDERDSRQAIRRFPHHDHELLIDVTRVYDYPFENARWEPVFINPGSDAFTTQRYLDKHPKYANQIINHFIAVITAQYDSGYATHLNELASYYPSHFTSQHIQPLEQIVLENTLFSDAAQFEQFCEDIATLVTERYGVVPSDTTAVDARQQPTDGEEKRGRIRSEFERSNNELQSKLAERYGEDVVKQAVTTYGLQGEINHRAFTPTVQYDVFNVLITLLQNNNDAVDTTILARALQQPYTYAPGEPQRMLEQAGVVFDSLSETGIRRILDAHRPLSTGNPEYRTVIQEYEREYLSDNNYEE